MELGIVIEQFILNYGLISIFIIVALEYANLSLTSEIVLLVAGVTRMRVGEFILYSSVGISLWNTILILIGFVIGDNMNQISYILGTYSKVVAILLVISFILYLVVKRKM